ncbi:hypothetical protein AB0E64_31695 [Streptomyces caelestis]|uniref:Uncharacterized protein n=1 Tax=Streptomyces caelestis TaxID=36816 RepID=A0A7W9H301_9ACTN|nr:hypothetical protein [Streptomyces caelestis]MBB5794431.1 hypothetical protein [Streptomyces caelestis]GGW30802.1 hypothetical protein GCM10010320_07480 [Streptomyces caelestis]
MAVTDALWWSLWWPWMTVWLVTAAGVLVLAVVLVRHARERRRHMRRWQSAYSICLYLDEQAVMDLYELGNYRSALEEAVELRTKVDTSVGAWSRVLSWLFRFRLKRDVSQETFRKFVRKDKPINVIGVVMEAFDRADAIVHADLTTLTVVPNRNLADNLADGRAVTLSRIGEFVSVKGVFTRVPDVAEGFELRAEYGEEQPPVYMRVVAPGNARRSIPAGTFTARCLGKMTGWREDTREVTLEAIAIFW